MKRISTMASILTSGTLAAAVGCGASDPAPVAPTAAGTTAQPVETAPAATADTATPAAEGHDHDFPAAIKSFHEAMAPLWHAEAGAERAEKTCTALPTLQQGAAKIAGEPVPAKAADKAEAWKTSTNGLTASLEALVAECGVEGRPAFDATFKAVHEAFHSILQHLGHKMPKDGVKGMHDEHHEAMHKDMKGMHDEHHEGMHKDMKGADGDKKDGAAHK